MHYAYPVVVEKAADGITVTCPNVPEMLTCGETTEEAIERAEDALVSALSFYVDDNRLLSVPSAADGRPVVRIPVQEAAKFALHDTMLQTRVSNVELAHRMGVDEKAVHRLRDPLHRSSISKVEAALQLLGRRLEVASETKPPGRRNSLRRNSLN
jgi:antitoxin HicB